MSRLAAGVSTTLLAELEDTSKATHQYLSAAMCKYSQAIITREDELATVGLRATNDPSEGTLATLTDILCNSGRLVLQVLELLARCNVKKISTVVMNYWLQESARR